MHLVISILKPWSGEGVDTIVRCIACRVILQPDASDFRACGPGRVSLSWCCVSDAENQELREAYLACHTKPSAGKQCLGLLGMLGSGNELG